MSFEKIIAISGKPGLFQIITQTRTGFLVESLLDGKKASLSLKSNVSLLTEISVYTYSGEVKLSEVLQKISDKENKASLSFNKDDKSGLESYFKDILPDYDAERVYHSDIKKILQWYNLLQSKQLLEFQEA